MHLLESTNKIKTHAKNTRAGLQLILRREFGSPRFGTLGSM